MTITGSLYTCRPDLIGFVNGLPLVVVELKKPGVSARQAFDENLTSYKHAQNGVPELFWFNALLIASNGTESRVGSLMADWERFLEWKRIEREDEPRRVSLEVVLRGTCEPSRLLGENHRYVFTLIHKFQLAEVLCDRRDVIVITDEAHRSQYDTLALNMRTALPNALFLAFTGTPLIVGEERTREVFGDYVSIYDFQQSVEDGATVPLFYENRTPELLLENPSLNDDIYALIEEAELSEETERRLERGVGRRRFARRKNSSNSCVSPSRRPRTSVRATG